MLLVCSFACKPPDGAAATPGSEPPAQERPAEQTNTYVSGPSADEDAAPRARPDSAEPGAAPTAAGIAAKVDTIQAARELALAVASADGGDQQLSPALVSTWPAKELALVFVVYPLAPSQSGISTFKVGVPFEVKVDLVEGTTSRRPLKRGALMQKIKVERDSATVRQNLEAAEQTLIDLLLERRPLERSFILLDGYREWFNHHLEMMTDLDKRMPSTIRWLRKPQ